MENIQIIRQRYQEANAIYATGKDTAYYEGKIVGIVEVVAACLGISWIEADNLLRKTE
jgi:hypothetical protein